MGKVSYKTCNIEGCTNKVPARGMLETLCKSICKARSTISRRFILLQLDQKDLHFSRKAQK